MPENPQLYVVTQGGQKITARALPLDEANKVADSHRKAIQESNTDAPKIEVKPFITG